MNECFNWIGNTVYGITVGISGKLKHSHLLETDSYQSWFWKLKKPIKF